MLSYWYNFYYVTFSYYINVVDIAIVKLFNFIIISGVMMFGRIKTKNFIRFNIYIGILPI